MASARPFPSRPPFQPEAPDAANVVSWVHLGDLHITKAGAQNALDLAAIVNDVNAVFAGSVSFVFLPGDVADDASRASYSVVRTELDRLRVPWCSILGDHDVHVGHFANFVESMSPKTHYAFAVGPIRFIAMNAFDVPHPASFVVCPAQLEWLRAELEAATTARQTKVLLLHCYPSDLKAGREELMELLRRFGVLLIDMGHTHYNEISNDGRTLYSATRSTGQIEEGPVGYSITNIDGGVMSWRFVELGKLPVVIITSPGDERLMVESNPSLQPCCNIRAKFWGELKAIRATATLNGNTVLMSRVEDSLVWEAQLDGIPYGIHPLKVVVEDAGGHAATDEIRIAIGDRARPERAERDQDNALGAWPEHGLVGTQLGPNKNGKKW